MALQGTLDSFSLDEVLGLLGQTKKSGALLVTSPETSGVLYLADGALCGADGDGTDELSMARNVEEFEARLLDLTFGLFRLRNGDFEFQVDRLPATMPSERVAIESILAQVRAVLADWDAVEAVIPSVEGRPRLVTGLAEEQVTIDRAAWRVMLAVDGQRSVREVAAHLCCSVVGASRALKDLINAGAVELDTGDGVGPAAGAVGQAATPTAADALDRALPDLESPDPEWAQTDATELEDGALASLPASIGPEVELEPEAGPVSGAEAVFDDLEPPSGSLMTDRAAGDGDRELEEEPVRMGDARDRGTLLRMFSSLRDS